jgi:hypothetical protein
MRCDFGVIVPVTEALLSLFIAFTGQKCPVHPSVDNCYIFVTYRYGPEIVPLVIRKEAGEFPLITAEASADFRCSSHNFSLFFFVPHSQEGIEPDPLCTHTTLLEIRGPPPVAGVKLS